eukprot:364462-Chlamydomonas_euryale.AAC.7
MVAGMPTAIMQGCRCLGRGCSKLWWSTEKCPCCSLFSLVNTERVGRVAHLIHGQELPCCGDTENCCEKGINSCIEA